MKSSATAAPDFPQNETIEVTMDFRSEMLAARVRRMRLQKRLSIEQLARAADVDKNTVVRLEKGEGRPNLKTLMSICDALGVTADRLMDMKTVENEDYFVNRRGAHSHDITETGLKVADLKAKLPFGMMNAVTLEISGEGIMRSHPGEEFFLCLKGRIELKIGSTAIELAKGDSVMFFGREPHMYSNADKENGPALALSVWIDEFVDFEANYLEDYHMDL